MAVDEERGSGGEAGSHGWGVPGSQLDQDEALPGGTFAFSLGPELVKERLLELEDAFHSHADNEGLSGGGGVGEQDVFEIVGAGRKDRGTLVDFGGIEKVEDGEVLDLEDFVHALDAESAFAVEEVGDMGLFESGLLGETESGQFTCFDAVPKDIPKIILQDFELHGRSIAPGSGEEVKRGVRGRG